MILISQEDATTVMNALDDFDGWADHGCPPSTEVAVKIMREALAEQPAQQKPVKIITPLMEQQMFDDWCPYKGNPDPRTVWSAAVDAVNMLLLAAAPQPAHQEPVIDAFLLTKLNTLYEKITPPPYFAAPDNRGIGLLGGRWTKNGAFQDVTKESVARHGGSDQDNMRFIVEVVNSWEAIRVMLAAAPLPAQHEALPCCGYTDASAIKWNPHNHVVQCHNCGQVYAAPPPAQHEALLQDLIPKPVVLTEPPPKFSDFPYANECDLASLRGHLWMLVRHQGRLAWSRFKDAEEGPVFVVKP